MAAPAESAERDKKISVTPPAKKAESPVSGETANIEDKENREGGFSEGAVWSKGWRCTQSRWIKSRAGGVEMKDVEPETEKEDVEMKDVEPEASEPSEIVLQMIRPSLLLRRLPSQYHLSLRMLFLTNTRSLTSRLLKSQSLRS